VTETIGRAQRVGAVICIENKRLRLVVASEVVISEIVERLAVRDAYWLRRATAAVVDLTHLVFFRLWPAHWRSMSGNS
jgi:hypothetical protein